MSMSVPDTFGKRGATKEPPSFTTEPEATTDAPVSDRITRALEETLMTKTGGGASSIKPLSSNFANSRVRTWASNIKSMVFDELDEIAKAFVEQLGKYEGSPNTNLDRLKMIDLMQKVADALNASEPKD